MLKFLTLVFFLPVSTYTLADIDLTASLFCTYQNGQYLNNVRAENVQNSTPLNWTFNGITSDKPTYIAGGYAGEISVVPIENGYSIFLPYKIGSNLLTIYKTGESTWNKQSNLFGVVNTQQYLGSCRN